MSKADVTQAIRKTDHSFSQRLAKEIVERLEAPLGKMPWPLLLLLVLGAAVLVLLIYAGGQPHPTEMLGFLLLVAGIGLAAGEVIGFLFGIPRTQQAAGGAQAGASTAGDQPFAVNTNLEQISDWLTKIIVGVGLVQLTKAPDLLDRLGTYLSAASPGGAIRGPVILTILGSFAVIGFFSGYLWTRIYLTEEFSQAERLARQRPEFSEGLIHALLYQPRPNGFTEAIRHGKEYLTKAGVDGERVWLYLACAYGQQYDFLSRAAKRDDAQLAQVKADALDAVRHVLQLRPESKPFLISLWDPGRATQGENDLVVFFTDPAFRELFEYPPRQP